MRVGHSWSTCHARSGPLSDHFSQSLRGLEFADQFWARDDARRGRRARNLLSLSLGIQPRVKSLRSGDTTPCRMTGVTLHRLSLSRSLPALQDVRRDGHTSGTKRSNKYFSAANPVNFCETREWGYACKTPPGWCRRLILRVEGRGAGRIIEKLRIGPSIFVVLINTCSVQYKDILLNDISPDCWSKLPAKPNVVDRVSSLLTTALNP